MTKIFEVREPITVYKDKDPDSNAESVVRGETLLVQEVEESMSLVLCTHGFRYAYVKILVSIGDLLQVGEFTGE